KNNPQKLNQEMAVLYKKDVLSPLETGNFWLSETPDQIASKSWDSSLPRITTWALFHHRPTSRQFHFFNTHFDHRGATAREQSAALIAQRIRGLRESAPVIVAGDFNTAAESSAPWKTLIESGLRDAWQTAANPAGPTGTFHGFRGAASEGDARIDWILYRGSFEVLSCETVTHNAEGRYPSDHYPVIAVFKWSASQ
ncbi:MAG TPA: endonuclease/exonuclease/phosphatase family protein, partial [Candidatus Hydrogenedentes bacterium]|nr:endonuclease/exonuclease/phosphatase family protein [Candidatus Hydrogenedentota bacterium]